MSGQGAGNVAETPSKSEHEMQDLSLMLMYLSSWTERQFAVRRFWKGFDFEVLNELADKGLINDSHRARSAYLTEQGVRQARELLAQYGLTDTQSS